MVMKLNRVWDIRMPPASKRMVNGKLTPTIKGAFSGRLMQKRRRVAIEIHGPEPSEEQLGDPAGPPQRGMLRSQGTSKSVIHLADELQDDDRIVLRILKKRKGWGLMRDDDSSSDESDDDDDDTEYDDGWVEYRKYDLDEIHNDVLDKDDWEATLGRASNMERRELKFDTKSQAEDFVGELRKLRSLVEERGSVRLEAFRKSQAAAQEKIKNATKGMQIPAIRSRAAPVDVGADAAAGSAAPSSEIRAADQTDFDMNDEIQLLIEIVSGTDLPIADHSSSDPYVVVYLGSKEIHRTKPIKNNVNPIWTVHNGSLFVLHCTVEEFFTATSGLCFYVKDHDTLSKNETMAKLTIPPTDLLEMAKSAGTDRFEMHLEKIKKDKTKKSSKYFAPMLNLRVRNATAFDISFLRQLRSIQKSKKMGVYADQAFVAPKAESVKLLKRESKVVDGIKLNRVKPYPDPSREESVTKWLSKESIMKECMAPSTNWIEAGSGDLGKVYLEVLFCDGLDNKDTTGKSDPFACIIYEDAIVNTDVVNDELSPRFMPWSKRAFAFNVQHPSSQILLAIVDFDSENGLDDHDPIGRTTIDITNFRPSTEYLLTYNLFSSVLDDERPKHGTVTVRLRIEYDSFRKIVAGSLAPPPKNYINTAKKHDFKTSFFVCNGEENPNRYDMDAIRAYRNELEGYLGLLYYITQAAMTVLLWRGHYNVSLFGQKLSLPIHSMVAFLMGIMVIENFNYIPSFTLFTVAWFLLAMDEQRQRHPSPWHKSMTFVDMWYALIRDKTPAIEIADHENEAAIRKYETATKERIEEAKRKAKQAEEDNKKLQEYLSGEEGIADQDPDHMETQVSGKPVLNPLAGILLPIQKILGTVCRSLRIVRSVATWDESIYSFIMVNACIVAGIALMIVPWGFILRWTARVVIWAVLGPWMKLVDIFVVRKLEEEGDNEVKAFKKLAQSKLDSVSSTRRNKMVQQENLTKHRAMKRYMFGKYVTHVPQFKTFRFPDIPLIQSFAKPTVSPPSSKIAETKHGQRLVGEMIPNWSGVAN